MSQAFHSLFPGPVLPQVVPVMPAEQEQLEQQPEQPEQPATVAKAPSKRPPRARNRQGEFKGDDPSTPDVNEAYVQPEQGNPEPVQEI